MLVDLVWIGAIAGPHTNGMLKLLIQGEMVRCQSCSPLLAECGVTDQVVVSDLSLVRSVIDSFAMLLNAIFSQHLLLAQFNSFWALALQLFR